RLRQVPAPISSSPSDLGQSAAPVTAGAFACGAGRRSTIPPPGERFAPAVQPRRSMSGPIRRKRNPLAVALMGLLMLVFLILGVGGSGKLTDIFAGTSGDTVIVAGQHTVSPAEFKRVVEQQKQQYEQRTGPPLTLDFIATR